MMRRLCAALVIVAVAACDGPAAPPPSGPLTLGRDGVMRAGGKDVSDPVALLRARQAGGVVSISIAPEAELEKVTRLLRDAESAGLERLQVESVILKLRARPAQRLELVDAPDIEATLGNVGFTVNPSRRTLTVTLPREWEHGQPIGEEAARLARELNAPAIALVLRAPAGMLWARASSVLSSLNGAIGALVVRHEVELSR